VKMYC